jgi:hypothetical protein
MIVNDQQPFCIIVTATDAVLSVVLREKEPCFFGQVL